MLYSLRRFCGYTYFTSFHHIRCEMILKDYIEKAHLDELMNDTTDTHSTATTLTTAGDAIAPKNNGPAGSTPITYTYNDVLGVITPHHVKAIETDFLKLMQSTHNPHATQNVSPVSRHIRGPAAALLERQNNSSQQSETVSHQQELTRNVEILAPIVATPRKSPRGNKSPRASVIVQSEVGESLLPERRDSKLSPRYCSRPLLPAVMTNSVEKAAPAALTVDLLAASDKSKDSLTNTAAEQALLTADGLNNKHPKDLERVCSVGSDQSTSSKISNISTLLVPLPSPRDSLTSVETTDILNGPPRVSDVTDDERLSSADAKLRASFDRGSLRALPVINTNSLSSPLEPILTVAVPIEGCCASVSLDSEGGTVGGGGYSLNAVAKHRNNSLNGGSATDKTSSGGRSSPKNGRTSPAAAGGVSANGRSFSDDKESPSKRNPSVVVLSPLSQVKASRGGSFDFQQASSTPSASKATTSSTSPEAAEGSMKLTTLVKVKIGTTRARRRSIGELASPCAWDVFIH